MKKNTVTVSDIFVKKLKEKVGKVLTREELMELWTLSGGPKSRFSYGLAQMKGKDILQSLGGGLYTVGVQESDYENYYWQILSLLIRRYTPSGAIIAHEKSVEYHLRNFEIPEIVVLYTRDTDKRITIGKYSVQFRTHKTGEKTGMKNMYQIFRESSIEGSIDGVKLRFLSLEASLLDVASLRIHESGLAEDLILKFLKKFSQKLSREALGRLVGFRYIRALNRIRSIAKNHGYTDLYEQSLDIIKKEGGGCYLNL